MLTAERIKDSTMSLKHIPTPRLLIDARATQDPELKNMMAMEIESRWVQDYEAMMKQREK